MHVDKVKSKQGKKEYIQILLRESYRLPGAPRSQVKKRTLLNLTKMPQKDVEAIDLGLKCKNDLSVLRKLAEGKVTQKQGRSVGAVYILHQLAKEMGLSKALGRSKRALLVLWMVLARLIDQGSRLSAVRLAEEHAACELLGLPSFTEDDLYQAMDWLDKDQARVEKRLFDQRHPDGEGRGLFLYDVTSSYLEGDKNELADWGYNRDKKRGKKQIVIGLLCDPEGTPVSTQVFQGNTSDIKTFEPQVKKAASRFGSEKVTFVGDRGMIKSGQIQDLNKAGFNYITAITKAQIRSMIKRRVFQLGLFDEDLCEVESGGLRYILRRNPIRADETAATRVSKLSALKALAKQQTQYLADHPKADQHTARKKVLEKEERLKLSSFVTVRAEDRRIIVDLDEESLREIAELDGCYALKTDLPREAADKETIHDRYKDLAKVERAFRTMKTAHLEVRPIFVRNAGRTRAHVFITMLALLLQRRLEAAWRDFDITVKEGLDQLTTLCSVETIIGPEAGGFLSVPQPRESMSRLFSSLGISPPTALPRRKAKVATKTKLANRRK